MEGLAHHGRGALIEALPEFPGVLRRVVELTPEHLRRRRGSDDGFAVVEHAWHLADLEEEGFAQRIQRLLKDADPQFPDFRGDEIALERRYMEQPIEPAMIRFAQVRDANRQRLLEAAEADWPRRGFQELVGEVTLGDLPRLMLEHDHAHADQLLALLRELGVEPPEELTRFAERPMPA